MTFARRPKCALPGVEKADKCNKRMHDVVDMHCTRCNKWIILPVLEKSDWPLFECPHCNCWPFRRIPNKKSHTSRYDEHGALRREVKYK